MQAKPSKTQYKPVEITDTGGVGEQAMRRAQALMAAPWNSMGKALAPSPEESQKPAQKLWVVGSLLHRMGSLYPHL